MKFTLSVTYRCKMFKSSDTAGVIPPTAENQQNIKSSIKVDIKKILSNCLHKHFTYFYESIFTNCQWLSALN